MEIIVFHPPIPGNGEETRFSGEQMSYGIHDGVLTIEDWTTHEKFGCASFAHGFWKYVITQKKKS